MPPCGRGRSRLDIVAQGLLDPVKELTAGGEPLKALHPLIERHAVGGVVPQVAKHQVVPAGSHAAGGKVKGIRLDDLDLIPAGVRMVYLTR